MPAAGKVTVVLALHWPCNGLSTYVTGSRPKEGRYAPRLHSLLGYGTLYHYLTPFLGVSVSTTLATERLFLRVRLLRVGRSDVR